MVKVTTGSGKRVIAWNGVIRHDSDDASTAHPRRRQRCLADPARCLGRADPVHRPLLPFRLHPDTAWTWTWGRFFLEIVPGVAAALGGLILLVSAFRPVAMFGAALAAAGGAWFVVGSLLGPVWASSAALGVPGGGPAALNPGQPT